MPYNCGWARTPAIITVRGFCRGAHPATRSLCPRNGHRRLHEPAEIKSDGFSFLEATYRGRLVRAYTGCYARGVAAGQLKSACREIIACKNAEFARTSPRQPPNGRRLPTLHGV